MIEFALWTTLRGWASAVWKWATESKMHLLVALCAILAAIALYERHRANEAEDALARWQREAKAAGTKATADQIAVNHKPAADSAAIAKVSDAKLAETYEAGRRAGAAYAAANGLRAACQNRAGRADLSRTDHPVPLDDRSRAPAELDDAVVISRGDFNLCTDNSGRIAQVYVDAQALIDARVAMKSKEN